MAADTTPAAPPTRSDWRTRAPLACWIALASAISLGVLGTAAVLLHEPWVFPSLGPTAFLLFLAPRGPQSGMVPVIAGHAIGVASGVFALAVFGLLHTPPDLEDLSWRRAAAAVTCLTLTLGLMVLLGVPHAPAGATTLIVGLGLMTTPAELAILMAAVVALALIARGLNALSPMRHRPPAG